jgi:hypothetical protein
MTNGGFVDCFRGKNEPQMEGMMLDSVRQSSRMQHVHEDPGKIGDLECGLENAQQGVFDGLTRGPV